MLKYKGVIFDLDGTLLNTILDLSDSVNAVLNELHCPLHSYGEYKKRIGHGFRNLIEVSLPTEAVNEDLVEKGLQLFLKAYDERYREKTVPYNGICELVDYLNQSGVVMAVNSNKRNDYTQTLINDFFPGIPFVAVFGERVGVPPKPDPSSALEIAAIMGVQAEKIVYIGDSSTDIQTGKNAGMDTIGVSWGFRGRTEMEQSGSSFVVDNPIQIWNIITGKGL